MSALSLVERFSKVTEKKNQDEFLKMSYADLSEQRITFGEAKVNQRYIDVVQQDPKYVKWFTGKYQDSQKPGHRSFLFFINMYVERMELTQGTGQTESPSNSPVQKTLKAKSKSAPRASSPPIERSTWSDDELSRSWSVEDEVNQQGHRLNNMESTLAQIAQQMQVLTQMVTQHHQSNAQLN
jgi:hypothetical protein